MAAQAKPSAAEFLPKAHTIEALAEAIQHCRGCELYKRTTHAVFGAGPGHAAAIFIGEQPGDEEDRRGLPFVGPAGRLLDEVLVDVGIARDQVYVTNAVKHFKWTPRSTRRLHAKPSAHEVSACRPWLEAEIEVVAPEIIVCLGATAAQSLLGSSFRITRSRGQWIDNDWCPRLLTTYHPSAILRAPDARAQMRREFKADLRKVAKALH